MEVRRWERRYGRRLLLTDAIVVVGAVFGAQWTRFGINEAELAIEPLSRGNFALTYSLVSTVLSLGWLIALAIGDTREPKIYGAGSTEYKRVINATLFTFGAYAIIAFLMRAQIGRGYLMIALPAGLLLLLLSRWAWRKRLHRQRLLARNQYRTLIVGEHNKCRHVASELLRSKFDGFHLVGAVSSSGFREISAGIPVLGRYADLLTVIDVQGIDTVVMTSSDEIAPEDLRRLGWELEARHIDLIVAAALTDVAGPRIHMRPVANMPLIHVDYPKFVGRKQFTKRMFDLIVSAILIVLLSPLFLFLAAIVRLTSKGPVLFRQQRVGLGGAPFRMLKFRSMVADAEARLSELQELSEGNGVLFKMKNDPRVTPAGRVMRKFSLDELPQLFNVFGGSMSLVGPRPPLPNEVASYEEWVHRRLLVKPGITGLWQVSGRSDLSWEDSIRLDLYYVENWSLASDLVLLARTVRTVLKPDGAY